MASVSTYNTSVLDDCVAVTPYTLRAVFPGRKLMLTSFLNLSSDYTNLANNMASLLNVAVENIRMYYIAFCNPCIKIGKDNEKDYFGTDDPLFGAVRPSFEFTGSTILVNGKEHKFVSTRIKNGVTFKDLTLSDKGFIQISLYILFKANDKTIVYDMHDGAIYAPGDVSKPIVSMSPEKMHSLTAKTVIPTKPTTSPSTEAAPTPKPASATTFTTTPKTTPAPTAKPVSTPPPVHATSSGPVFSRAKGKKTKEREYKNETLFNYEAALKVMFVTLLVLCVLSMAAEMTSLAFNFNEMAEMQYGSIVICAFILGAILLEGLSATVYKKSYMSVEKTFPFHYKIRDKILVPPGKTKCTYRPPARVLAFSSFVVLHLLTRILFIVLSNDIFYELSKRIL